MFDEEDHTKIAELAEGLGVEVAALMPLSRSNQAVGISLRSLAEKSR